MPSDYPIPADKFRILAGSIIYVRPIEEREISIDTMEFKRAQGCTAQRFWLMSPQSAKKIGYTDQSKRRILCDCEVLTD